VVNEKPDQVIFLFVEIEQAGFSHIVENNHTDSAAKAFAFTGYMYCS
jgi:hypothetical protein